MTRPPSPDRTRVLGRKIDHRLIDIERHRDALEERVARFEAEGGRQAFAQAALSEEPQDLIEAYALERAFEVIQNYLAELTRFALELAGLAKRTDSANAPRDFERLRDAEIISAKRCQNLIRLQQARNTIAHEYDESPPEETYDAAKLLLAELPHFLADYGAWLKDLPYLNEPA